MRSISGQAPTFRAYSFVCTALSAGVAGLQHRTVCSATQAAVFRFVYRARPA